MIELQGVRKVFGNGAGTTTVLAGVDLAIARGETHCLIGASGSGKTTALRTVNRLVEPSAGRVLVDGQDVATVDPIALRRRIGYVIQSGGLFPHLTVARNVALLCELAGWSRQDTRRRAGELLDLVRLPPAEFGSRYPAELSGGERQRVGVARSLALDPPCVLMDEPFGALDPITRRQLHREFRELESIVQKTILLVTHDLEEAFALGDRVSLLHQGCIVQTGTAADFAAAPASPWVAEFVAGHARKTCHGRG